MAKLALYRKYRPQIFDELFGQDHIVRTLKNSVKNGNFSHAYLFSGPRGTGKTSVARILAKAINCQKNIDGNPDNKCGSCDLINKEKAMDIIEIDAASHTQVDNIRDIIVERAKFAPTNLKYKVYIIDEAHMLSKSSFNALLKTLEEPPEHTIFILATTEPNKIIPTIISRCQKFDFKKINQEDMTKRLDFIAKEENIKIDEEVLETISRISEGGFRDAISLMDQLATVNNGEISIDLIKDVLGISSNQNIEKLALSLANNDVITSLDTINSVIQDGVDPHIFSKYFVEFLRTLLISSLTGSKNISDNQNVTKEVLNITTSDNLLRMIDIFIKTESDYKNSSISNLFLEVAVAKICTQNTTETKKVNLKESVKQEVIVKEVKKASSPISGSSKVKWQELMLEIKNKNNSIHAILKVCEPELVDEKEQLVLHFPYKFHKERVEDIRNRQMVEEAVSKVYGKKYQIKCSLKPATNVIVQEKPKKDDLLNDAMEIFGGEIIE